MKIKLIKATTSLIACFLALIAQQARANEISYNIDSGNTAISGYTGPYAIVTVDRTSSTTATITFSALKSPSGLDQYLFGDGSSVGVNVNATTWDLGAISGTQLTGFTAVTYSNTGSKNVSGFGTFNQTIKSSGGYTSSSDEVSFTLTNTSGTWLDAADVLIANSDNYSVEAHIFVATAPANVSEGALNTGFAANGGPDAPSVPDGGTTAMLLGLAVSGLGLVRRKLG